jgi:hypothetical protein
LETFLSEEKRARAALVEFVLTLRGESYRVSESLATIRKAGENR